MYVSHLRDFASHFFSGSQECRLRLQSSFFLGEQTGTGGCCNKHCEKDRFHDRSFCVSAERLASKLMGDLKGAAVSPWRAVALAKAASPPHEMGRGLETPFIDLDWQAERLPYSPE
jgi:hypothetical protein